MNPLGLLLDFVNVKDWDVKILRELQQGLTFAAQIRRKRNRYDGVKDKQSLTQRFREVFESDLTHVSFRSPGKPGSILTFDYGDPIPNPYAKALNEEECFVHLATLQKKWRDTLKDTANQGPDVLYLNSLVERAKFILTTTEDPFSPIINPYNDETLFEGRIEEEYMTVFLSGKGGDFRKLRVCDNPSCGKMFLFIRSTKLFCDRHCRDQHNNEEKIESGYLATYQKRKRDEGHPSYWRK